MSQLEFLHGILPEGARYSLRVIKKASGAAFNHFFTSVESMLDDVQGWVDQGFDVYYVTAGFGAAQNATAENAVSKRELYVDIDCGPSKSYADKSLGAQALRNFCKDVGLPRPTVVDSGNGLHAHWIFSSAVAIHEWTAVAGSLKALCKEKKFDVDSACTADVVRVLRIPDTTNFKNNTTVAQVTPIQHYEFSTLRSIIGTSAMPDLSKAKEFSKGSTSGLTKSLSGIDPNKVSKFETIWAKSIKGTGCAQISNAGKNADTLPEPLWRAVLSIAQHCDDRDWAIHEISKDHPNYSPEETESKASSTKGPYTCETFQGLDEGGLCAGCAFSGKITSPIQIGNTIKEAPAKPVPVEFAGRTFEIPTYPFPYTRGKHGGIYIRVRDSDGGEEAELIYPHDLYVYKRMRDAELGDVVWMRHHLPFDGVRDFMVSQKEIGAIERFRERLNEQGVAVFTPAQLIKLQAYVAKSIQELQLKDKAEEMHSRFGWTKNDTFVVGNREYTKNGVIYAPVARHLEKYVRWFTPKGSLAEWKRIADAYNHPDFDLHALGLLAGFGSVLMALTPENGGVLNFFSKKSGTGKTTILQMVNSIFGDPKALMKDSQDTHLTKVHRMGILNGIPLTLDEMTNVTPNEISNLLYGSTQGRARDRMESGRNAERHNDLTWKMMTVWSGNTSAEDRLTLIKADPQGEMARVLDIHLRTPVPASVLKSQELFNALQENYGHAGHEFLNHVVPSLEHVKNMWAETRLVIYSRHAWTQTERYKLNNLICCITAGIITNSIGLTNFNIRRIAKSGIRLVRDAGEQQQAQITKSVESFASFINKNVNNMLSVDSMTRVTGMHNEPYVKPKGALVVRYEPDTKILYIVQKDFNRWCAENYVNAKEMRSLFADETGRELKIVKKRMGAGWDADFGAVNAYCIEDAVNVLGLDSSEIEVAKPE